jgi:hypothetical protein
MKYLLLLLLSGCATPDYYAHLWCQPTSGKEVSVGIYKRWDGMLEIKVYDAQCKYYKFESVILEHGAK